MKSLRCIVDQNTGKINYTFRLLYAIGIILIVAGHCQGGGIPLFEQWFAPYGYHLGLFVFCSGYFYKDTYERHFGSFLIKKLKRLILPMYLWNIFYALLVWILSYAGFTIGSPVTWYKILIAPLNDGHQFLYNMGGWFVVPLFMVEVVTVLIRILLRRVNAWAHAEVLFFFLSLTLGIFGCATAMAGFNTGWWLALVRMLYFMPFYGMGIFYRRVLEEHDRLPSMAYFTICIGIAMLIIAVYGRPLSYTPSFCNDFYQGPLMPYIVGFVGIAFWLRIAKFLTPAIGRSRPVSLLADNTYSIMINQFLGFMLVKTVFAMLSQTTLCFHDFNTRLYHRQLLLYLYLPNGVEQWKILYLAAGIIVPIWMQAVVNRICRLLRRVKDIAA